MGSLMAVVAVLAGGLPVTGAGTALAAPAPGTMTTRVGGPGSGPALSVSQRPTRVSPGPGGSVYVADTSAVARTVPLGAPPRTLRSHGHYVDIPLCTICTPGHWCERLHDAAIRFRRPCLAIPGPARLAHEVMREKQRP